MRTTYWSWKVCCGSKARCIALFIVELTFELPRTVHTLFSFSFQVNVPLPIHPSLRRAYEALEPLFLEHIITEEVRY